MTKGEGKAEVIDLKGLRRAGSPVEIEPLGDDEDRKRGSIAARLRRLAHDRLEAGGRLRIGIGCAPCLGDAERLERAEEIGVLLGRHHADKATEAKPGLKGVGAGESGTEQDQEAVEEAVVLDRAMTAWGTAPVNSSLTKRWPPHATSRARSQRVGFR